MLTLINKKNKLKSEMRNNLLVHLNNKEFKIINKLFKKNRINNKKLIICYQKIIQNTF